MKMLKDLLKQHRVSYRHLSMVTGIPLTTLNGKMQGESKFTVDEMAIICEAIGEDPSRVWMEFLSEKKRQTDRCG